MQQAIEIGASQYLGPTPRIERGQRGWTVEVTGKTDIEDSQYGNVKDAQRLFENL